MSIDWDYVLAVLLVIGLWFLTLAVAVLGSPRR